MVNFSSDQRIPFIYQLDILKLAQTLKSHRMDTFKILVRC